MKKFTFTLLILAILPIIAFAQSTRSHKYNIGIEVNAGHSFPAYNSDSRWKGTFYPVGGLNVLVMNRMGKSFQSELGIGISGFALNNQGPYDNYVFDFVVPQIFTGIQYSQSKSHHLETFVRLNSGIQAAYKGSTLENFSEYQVLIQNKNALNFYLQPSIGLKNKFNKRINGHKNYLGYEIGSYFRMNLYSLGTATFIEENHVTTTSPSGNSLGVYFRILLPVGNKMVKLENNQEPKEPRTKTTRYL